MPIRLLVVVAASLVASHTCAAFTVHGVWHDREDFAAGPAAPDAHLHELVFAVRQNNLPELERILLDVSDPASANYGKHLTHKQVHELTANPAATRAIVQFCNEHGLSVKNTSAYGEYVTVHAPVATWNGLLGTRFVQLYRAQRNIVQSVVRSTSYTMPSELVEHVYHVLGAVELPLRDVPPLEVHSILPKHATALSLGSLQGAGENPCHSLMTPQCWNYYYNQTTNDARGQSQLVFGQRGYVISPTDMQTFATSSGIDVQTIDCPNGGCDGDSTCQGYDPNMKPNGYLCVEGDLDVQWITAVGQSANNTFWQVQNLDTPFLEFITHIASLAEPPGVVTISYGSLESEMLPHNMDLFTAEAMKLGAQGVSILAANGDDGVAGYKARNDSSKCGYTTSFPGTCPWVTSVGGTQNAENDPEDHQVHTLREWAANAPDQQGPWTKVTTAGGFSNYFARPAYQNASVDAYFNTAESKRAKPGYSTTGRGIPDVSTNAINYHIFITSFNSFVSGTSGSSPALAGMVSVLNAQRAKKNKPKLGFLNPLLYASPQLAKDVTIGWNNCTAVPTICCEEGFTAAAGWDPLTGIGSPNYMQWAKVSL
jgi:tripeptidyl-peptidase-1